MTCRKCRGKGKIECFTCGGEGLVENFIGLRTKDCADCGGRGYHYCTACSRTPQRLASDLQTQLLELSIKVQVILGRHAREFEHEAGAEAKTHLKSEMAGIEKALKRDADALRAGPRTPVESRQIAEHFLDTVEDAKALLDPFERLVDSRVLSEQLDQMAGVTREMLDAFGPATDPPG